MVVLEELRQMEADRQREHAERYRLAVLAVLDGGMNAVEARPIIDAAGKTVEQFAADFEALAEARRVKAERVAARKQLDGMDRARANLVAASQRGQERAAELEDERKAWLAAHAQRVREAGHAADLAKAEVAACERAREYLLDTGPVELRDRASKLRQAREAVPGRINDLRIERRRLEKGVVPVPPRPSAELWRTMTRQECERVVAHEEAVAEAIAAVADCDTRIAELHADDQRMAGEIEQLEEQMLVLEVEGEC